MASFAPCFSQHQLNPQTTIENMQMGSLTCSDISLYPVSFLVHCLAGLPAFRRLRFRGCSYDLYREDSLTDQYVLTLSHQTVAELQTASHSDG